MILPSCEEAGGTPRLQAGPDLLKPAQCDGTTLARKLQKACGTKERGGFSGVLDGFKLLVRPSGKQLGVNRHLEL